MGGRPDRVRENQEAFRRANDEIAARARELDEDPRVPVLCECPDRRCTQVLVLSLAEYDDVRADDARHVIAPGHALSDDEHVLEESDRYWITEQNGNSVRNTSASA